MKAAKLNDDDSPLAAANDGVLPSDFLYDVLLRLPAKDLCRLRLVCRRWRSLTSDDPIFAKAHRSRNGHLVACNPDSGEVQVLDLFGNILKRIYVDDERRFGIEFNAQLDLVCVDVSWGHACVLNLATGAVIFDLTCFKLVDGFRRPLPPRFVLARVPATGVYKALLLHNVNGVTGKACDISTLGCGSGGRWRAGPRAPVPLALPPFPIVVIRGVAYFTVVNDFYRKTTSGVVNDDDDDTGYNGEPDSIASFDFEVEEWRPKIIQGPVSRLNSMSKEKVMASWYGLHWSNFMLAGLNDCLVSVGNNEQDRSLDVWFMEDMDDTSSSLWTKRYSVKYHTDLRSRALFQLDCLLALSSDDEKMIFWSADAQMLKAYDLNTRTWTNLTAIKTGYFAPSMHHGSLLCPRVLD